MFYRSIFAFVIQHTVAIAFVLWIRNLLPKLLTDALVFLGGAHPAGAVAAFGSQTLLDLTNHIYILIKSNCHYDIAPLCQSFPIMMWIILLSDSRIPSRAMALTMWIVFSTPFTKMPLSP